MEEGAEEEEKEKAEEDRGTPNKETTKEPHGRQSLCRTARLELWSMIVMVGACLGQVLASSSEPRFCAQGDLLRILHMCIHI